MPATTNGCISTYIYKCVLSRVTAHVKLCLSAESKRSALGSTKQTFIHYCRCWNFFFITAVFFDKNICIFHFIFHFSVHYINWSIKYWLANVCRWKIYKIILIFSLDGWRHIVSTMWHEYAAFWHDFRTDDWICIEYTFK